MSEVINKEFVPEVLFNTDGIIVFDTDADNWEEPDDDQKEDEEQDPIILRKKLHIQQVRSTIYDDVAFVCSKTGIKRDYIVFLSDIIIYGDMNHSSMVDYLHVKRRLERTIIANDFAIEMIKKHNREVFKYLPFIPRSFSLNKINTAEDIIKQSKEIGLYDTHKEEIVRILDALIYTEDDILII